MPRACFVSNCELIIYYCSVFECGSSPRRACENELTMLFARGEKSIGPLRRLACIGTSLSLDRFISTNAWSGSNRVAHVVFKSLAFQNIDRVGFVRGFFDNEKINKYCGNVLT